MKLFVIFLCSGLLAGCDGTKPEQRLGPNGRPAYTVECLQDEKNCYPAAKKLCPTGYVVTNSKFRAFLNWQGFEVQNALKYTLTIECNE